MSGGSTPSYQVISIPTWLAAGCTTWACGRDNPASGLNSPPLYKHSMLECGPLRWPSVKLSISYLT